MAEKTDGQKDVVLRIREITKTYRGEPVLKGVSIELKKGHIYGFIGNNGAGKTTLLRILGGLIRQDSGELEFFSGRSRRELEQGRERMGFLIESPVYYPDMSAAQNLAIQGSIKGVRDKAHIQELLELTGLQGAGWKQLKDFSTGTKQRYGIAFALLGWPEVLILDEPLNGMDVPNMDVVTEILRKLNEERGITILLSSHLLERLYSLATDYIFLDQGVILQTASKEELDRQIPKEGIEEYFRRLVSGKVSGRA